MARLPFCCIKIHAVPGSLIAIIGQVNGGAIYKSLRLRQRVARRATTWPGQPYHPQERWIWLKQWQGNSSKIQWDL